MNVSDRKGLIEDEESFSVREQCRILSVNRSSLYYIQKPESPLNLKIMRMIDRQHTDDPARYGQKKMAEHLSRKLRIPVSRNRVQRLMRLMGLEGDYQKKRTTAPDREHKKYPYLLRDLHITHSNQVWCSDITYIPMRYGYMYLSAVMDWYSRYVLSWEISNTLETDFCVIALVRALKRGRPEIFNTDQGSQFTSAEFTGVLQNNDIKISMDGKGRSLDNIFIERLWRTLKYEDIYKRSYETPLELNEGLNSYFNFYNRRRIHQALNYSCPEEYWKKSLTENRSSLIIAGGQK